MTTENGNRMIAKFMGREIVEGNFMVTTLWDSSNLIQLGKINCYHSSWDLLKPVIDKIFTYALAYPDQVRKIRDISIVVELGACWERVVQFIQWYTQLKPGVSPE